MKMKKKAQGYFLMFIAFILIALNSNSQTIAPYFFGQNAWMPDTIGTKVYYGKLHKHWGDIKTSGSQMVRFGGIGPDTYKPTNHQYIKMVDSIRTRGMEPVLQVPFDKYRFTASQAAEIVRYVNKTKGRNVKYWIIGNEPNLGYGYTSASQIAPYIKSFASAMKAVDPTIKIIGPEVAWYDHAIMRELTNPGGSSDITGKDASGRYYVDVISFHTYPFAGEQTRSSVITKLATSLDVNLSELKGRLNNCNSYHGRSSSPVKMAITEANVNYKNNYSDNLYGSGANSFIGGQFWTEMMAISLKHGVDFINFWSVIEGNTNELNIGFIDRATFAKKPTFYHFQMMANNFKGTFINGTDNQANAKAFGSKSGSQISVMILNQDQAANFNYTVRLDNSTASGTNALKVNVNAGVAKEYSGTINNQSTTVLVFDVNGNIVKKIEYKMNGHASSNLKPQETILGNGTVSTGTGSTGTGTTGTGTTTTTTTTTTTEIASVTPSGTVSLCAGSVVLTAKTGTNYTYLWRKDGVYINTAISPTFTVTSPGSYQVKVTQGSIVDWSAPVTVTTGQLNPTITANGALTFATGGNVLLTANTGTGITYQWKKNGVAISGATNSTYTATTAGTYTVAEKAGTCVATSAGVAVNVTTSSTTTSTPLASITPSGTASFCAGGSVTLSAKTGTGYIYQWRKNNVNITGATLSTYKATSSGSYQVKVTQGSNVDYSAPVTVIAGQLTATITAGGSLTFATGGRVVLNANTGTGLTYQWKKNGVNISGATTASYTATTSGNYTVYETQTGGCSATSDPVAVNVTSSTATTTTTTTSTALATITPSGSVTICTGGSIRLSAKTGTGYLYQWKKNGVNISGATASYYNATSAGSYQVKVTSGSTVDYSAPVTVTVGTILAKVTTSGSTTIPQGGSVTLSGPTGGGYTYQWKKNGANISGATASTYRVTTAGSYQLKLSSGTCNDWSAPVTVSVTSAKTQDPSASISSEGTGGMGLSKGSGSIMNPGSITGQAQGRPMPGKGQETDSLAAANEQPEGEEQNDESLENDSASFMTSIIDSVLLSSENVFDVRLGPNPTKDIFNITVISSDETKPVVNVYDLNGRLCSVIKNIEANLPCKFGDELSSGLYIIEIVQGEKKEIIKTIKSN